MLLTFAGLKGIGLYRAKFDTLTPINLIFLFLCRKDAISRLALFLRMSKSLIGNNKDLDILLNLIRLKKEQFNT
jgi:hypothetical protein